MNRNHVHRPEPELDLSPEALVVYTFVGLVLCVVGWLLYVFVVGAWG